MRRKTEMMMLLRAFFASAVMNLTFFASAVMNLMSLSSWRSVMPDLARILAPWGIYIASAVLLPWIFPDDIDILPTWVIVFLSNLFWPMLILSTIAFIASSFTSIIPVAVALVAAILLYLLGFSKAAQISIFMVLGAAMLYVVLFLVAAYRRNAGDSTTGRTE